MCYIYVIYVYILLSPVYAIYMCIYKHRATIEAWLTYQKHIPEGN